MRSRHRFAPPLRFATLAGVAALLAPVVVGAPQAGGSARLALHLLDYVAVDYPAAVRDGEIADAAEYAEQLEFSRRIGELLDRLPAVAERAGLRAAADRLCERVAARAPAAEIGELARELHARVVRAYRVPVAPSRLPAPAAADGVYRETCAPCHGVAGRGDGPAGRALDPPPADFTDRGRMAQRSLFGLFETISLGVEGTGMASFAHLPQADRWSLALHVAGLSATPDERERGRRLWQSGSGRRVVPGLEDLATATAADLAARHGTEAPFVLAYLYAEPSALEQGGGDPLDLAAALLDQSRQARDRGDLAQASELALRAYLDGFELVEAPLAAVDRRLARRIEAGFAAYRSALSADAADPGLAERAAELDRLLAEARARLDGGGLDAAAAFTGAAVILLREGLEALLVVAALLALLRRAGRRDALRYVHAGWIAALGAGVATWVLAMRVVRLGGASREMTEGVTALLAAAVLLYVGFWLHDKTHARRWNDYIRRLASGTLAGSTLLALALASFLAVYREVFETVLFYQALAARAGPAGYRPVLAGFAAAASVLAVLAWLVFRLSVRLPLRPFFAASSALLAGLAVVFVGKGIAALQEAGALPVRVLDLPGLPVLGIYPTLQGMAIQGCVAAVVVAGFLWTGRAGPAGVPS